MIKKNFHNKRREFFFCFNLYAGRISFLEQNILGTLQNKVLSRTWTSPANDLNHQSRNFASPTFFPPPIWILWTRHNRFWQIFISENGPESVFSATFEKRQGTVIGSRDSYDECKLAMDRVKLRRDQQQALHQALPQWQGDLHLLSTRRRCVW